MSFHICLRLCSPGRPWYSEWRVESLYLATMMYMWLETLSLVDNKKIKYKFIKRKGSFI